ncbi:MAG: LytTR family DNA-binding domain-containing protein [Pedobacter sp.]|jgi:two-component system LytT family response regulator
MTRCIIVDDEPLAQQVIENHINKTEGLILLKKCGNAIEAFKCISQANVDLIFLDIKMPSMNGIEFIKSLRNPPAFIFTTAYSEHAVISYDLEAVDYLLKPITYERFLAGIAKFLKQNVNPIAENPFSYFKVNGKMIKVEHRDIIYAQSIKDYIIINTLKGNYITHMTMKYLAELLPDTSFRRVHRSFLISIAHITSIGRNEIELQQMKIPIGENFRVNIRNISSGRY